MAYTKAMRKRLTAELRNWKQQELEAARKALLFQGKTEGVQLINKELNRRLNQAA